MQARLSPDFKTHRVSTFRQEEQRLQQTLVVSSQRTVGERLPISPKADSSFQRQLFQKLRGEAQEVLSINAPSMRNQLKSTRELNRSNVSIVNQFFREDGRQQQMPSSRRQGSSPSCLERDQQSIKAILDRKDFQVNFFKQEMDKLRQQARMDRINIENLQESLRQAQQHRPGDHSLLQREKDALQQRLHHLEQQMQHLQRQMIEKSKASMTMSSLSTGKAVEALQLDKQALQRQLTAVMRRDIELQNEIEYLRARGVALEKQLTELQSARDESLDNYKREITYEMTILSNLNESIVKEGEHLKTTVKLHEAHIKDLEGQLTQTRMDLAEANLKQDKKLVVMESELRTARRALEEKSFELKVLEGQMKNLANSRSMAEIDKENVIVQLQDQLRQTSIAHSTLREENSGLTRENTDLHLQLNDVRMKCQESQSQSRMLHIENENLLAASRALTNSVDERRQQQDKIMKLSVEVEEYRTLLRIKQEKISELSARLQERQNQGKVAQSDFARIQSQIVVIKTHLKGQIEQLNREKQILQDSNRDLRLQMQAELGSTNSTVQTLQARLEDREKRVSVLEQQLNSRSHAEDTMKASREHELEQARAFARREQVASETLRTRFTQEQFKSQQLQREKSDLLRQLQRLRLQLKQQEGRQLEGQQLALTVQQLKRELTNLQQQSRRSSEQTQHRHNSELSQKTAQLMAAVQQQRKSATKLEEAQSVLRDRQLELLQLKRASSHLQSTESALKLREVELQKLRQQCADMDELRRIIDEQRGHIRQLQAQSSQKLATRTRRLAELEHYEKLFEARQQKIAQLVRENISRLVQHKSYEQLNSKDRRQLLFNQLIEVAQSMLGELNQLKGYTRDLEHEHRRKLQELDRAQVELNSLTYEKSHLINQMESMVSRLKYVENSAQYLAGLAKSSESEGKRLKSLNKSLKGKLQKELNERQWLQNRVKQAAEPAVSSPRIERAKQQRVQIYNLMKETIDMSKQ